jgi:hypothetical protein
MRVFLGLGWVIAILLVYASFARDDEPPALILGEVRQDVALDPLPLALTNTPIVLWEIANEYRTLPGWIAVSNKRVYAGLHDRVWSAAYMMPVFRHEVRAYFGTGLGVGYAYLLRDRLPVGAALFSSGGVFVTAGYRW